jgi:methionyl-tRNA formyltransferase
VRTVYLGSSEFAVQVLKALAASSHKPSLVVTPPDRPRGRGRKLASPPAADAAKEVGIDLLQTTNVNDPDALAAIERAQPDAVAVCEFGQLIREPLLSRYLILNVHPSLLPRWRGAAPIERALREGYPVTGVPILIIVPGLDSGPIALMSPPETVQVEDTAGTLSARLAQIGGALLVAALDRAEQGRLELAEQSEQGVTYAEKLRPTERRLDLGRPAVELERVVRALTPDVGAYIALGEDERLGITSARVADEELAPGELRASDGRLLVGSADGTLELLEVRPPGARTMPARDFMRGHSVPARVQV